MNTTELEAAAFRRLLRHLNEERPDVQNIALMILAGFCRNCLADWYREAAAAPGNRALAPRTVWFFHRDGARHDGHAHALLAGPSGHVRL